jgi:hypothetical protein
MAEQAARPLGVGAVVDVLAKDLRAARQYIRICEELISAGRDEQALEWARRGLKERGNERDHGLGELRVITISLCGRLGRTREAVELAWEQFAVTPSLEAYKRLCEHATTEGTWSSWRDQALAVLNAQPRIGESAPVPGGYRPPGHSTLIHVLLWEGDEEAAWRAAQQGGCADGLWLELARRRASTHPADAATVFRQQIEAAVALTKRDGYDRALSLLAELRACHERMDTLDRFDVYVTRLRDANSRKQLRRPPEERILAQVTHPGARLLAAGAVADGLLEQARPPSRRRLRRSDVVTYRVRIDLKGTKPPAWRRLELCDDHAPRAVARAGGARARPRIAAACTPTS